MAQFTGITRQSTREEVFALHREGCPDIERRERLVHGGQPIRLTSTSLADALNELIDEDLVEMGYSTSDVRVFPCAKEA